MKISAKIKYQEKYLPTKRHRIYRVREVEDTITLNLREVKKEDAPVAMAVTAYSSYLDENGQDKFGLRDSAYLAFDNKLYTEERNMSGALDEGPYSMEMFLRALNRAGDCYYSWEGKSREDMIRSVTEFVDSHILIDETLYRQTNEPRYVVQTFGLGHNHGGTSLSITTWYNPNLSKNGYFNALQRDEAIAYANMVAERRGDTDYVGKFGKETIQVYMPEMVHCNPQLEHGDGDPFLNSLKAITEESGSVLEAGLLAISATKAQVSDERKPSLDDKIQSAASRATKQSDAFTAQPEKKQPEK